MPCSPLIDRSSEANSWDHEGKSRNEAGNIVTNIRWTFKDGSTLTMDMEFFGSLFRYTHPAVLNQPGGGTPLFYSH